VSLGGREPGRGHGWQLCGGPGGQLGVSSPAAAAARGSTPRPALRRGPASRRASPRRQRAHRVLHDRQQPHERRLRMRLEHLGRARRDDAQAVGRALPQVRMGRGARVQQHWQHLRRVLGAARCRVLQEVIHDAQRDAPLLLGARLIVPGGGGEMKKGAAPAA
jgi:hypothetical protein